MGSRGGSLPGKGSAQGENRNQVGGSVPWVPPEPRPVHGNQASPLPTQDRLTWVGSTQGLAGHAPASPRHPTSSSSCLETTCLQPGGPRDASAHSCGPHRPSRPCPSLLTEDAP